LPAESLSRPTTPFLLIFPSLTLSGLVPLAWRRRLLFSFPLRLNASVFFFYPQPKTLRSVGRRLYSAALRRRTPRGGRVLFLFSFLWRSAVEGGTFPVFRDSPGLSSVSARPSFFSPCLQKRQLLPPLLHSVLSPYLFCLTIMKRLLFFFAVRKRTGLYSLTFPPLGFSCGKKTFFFSFFSTPNESRPLLSGPRLGVFAALSLYCYCRPSLSRGWELFFSLPPGFLILISPTP